MNNRNLLGLVAMAMLVGAAPVQSAGTDQSGNPQTPVSSDPQSTPLQSTGPQSTGPLSTELQLAETRVEWAIRPEGDSGSATSEYPEGAAHPGETSGEISSEAPGEMPGVASDQPSSWEASSAIQTDGDIRYMSGGVGASERAELDAMASQFNLRLMFATAGSGEYLSSVQVNIQDTRSGPVLTAMSKGPLFYAQLPAGNYNVEVTPAGLRGHDATQRKAFQLDGSGQARLDFYWQE